MNNREERAGRRTSRSLLRTGDRKENRARKSRIKFSPSAHKTGSVLSFFVLPVADDGREADAAIVEGLYAKRFGLTLQLRDTRRMTKKQEAKQENTQAGTR